MYLGNTMGRLGILWQQRRVMFMTRYVLGAQLGLWVGVICAQQSSFSGFINKVPLNVRDQLQVNLVGVGLSSSWVVGAIANDSVDPVAGVGSGALADRDPTGGRRLIDLENHAAIVGPGTISVDLKGARSRGIVVLLTIPSHTRLRCSVEGRVVFDSPVVSTALIKDGRTLNEPVRNLGTLLIRVQRDPSPPQPPITRMQDGTFVVSKAMLRDSLRGEVKLPALGPAACGCVRHAMLLVRIGVDGRVLSVPKKGGDPEIGAVAAVAAQDLVFKPIIHQGNAVEAQGWLTVQADRDGNLRILWPNP
jgi:hypothetical protein